MLTLITSLSACNSDDAKEEIIEIIDKEAPVITLTGEAAVTVNQGATYEDEGATVTDNLDKNVVVVVAGDTVDTDTVGTYTITYNATDVADNKADEVTRVVTVVAVKKSLTGTAAGGAAIVGIVTVKDSLGATKTAPIELDGSYDIDVTDMTAPFRLRAEGTVGSKHYILHSYAEDASSDNKVNITPFTDLIIANAAQQLAHSFFDSTETTLDATELAAQESALQEKLQSVFDALGLDAAIDLLSHSFSADHSGLDAALDLINIETDTTTNVATITNVLDGTTIEDDVTDTDDNTEELVFVKEDVVSAGTDTQSIVALFGKLSDAFAEGVPTAVTIEDFFAPTFIENDENLDTFLSDITTDEGVVGFSFSNLSVENLDSTKGTAQVFFNGTQNDYTDPRVEYWYVKKDSEDNWLFTGNQHIVDLSILSYHCDDYNALDDDVAGACGINASAEDIDTSNNGIDGAIMSGKIFIVDNKGAIKESFYLGTPDNESEMSIYNESQKEYTGDWREFGEEPGQINASNLVAGGKIKYYFYKENLDLTNPETPAVVGDAVATYYSTVAYSPATTPLYPIVQSSIVDDLASYVDGEDLIVSWELDESTMIAAVRVQVHDSTGAFVNEIDEDVAADITQYTVLHSFLEESSALDGVDLSMGYTIKLTLYARDKITAQEHSVNYSYMVDANSGGATGGEALTCGYESGWIDDADGGLGEPEVPNSFADFQGVVSNCATPLVLTAASFSGKTFTDTDTETGDTESRVFDTTSTATKASPATGTFTETGEADISFKWYIETVDSITYMVLETNSDFDPDLPADMDIRETAAVRLVSGTEGTAGAVYNFNIYAEQSNYGDMVRDTASDGEIWNIDLTLD